MCNNGFCPSRASPALWPHASKGHPMKIRSILTAIGALDIAVTNDAVLRQEAVCQPSNAPYIDAPEGTNAVKLVREQDLRTHLVRGHRGIIVTIVEGEIPKKLQHPSPDLIVCTSSLPFEEAERRFNLIPLQAPTVEAEKGRLFDAFQKTHNIQQFATRAQAIIGNPIIVVNNDGRILASAGDFPAGRDDIAEQIKNGYMSLQNRQEVSQLEHSARQMRFPFLSRNSFDGQVWATAIAYYKNLEMGRFDSVATKRPFDARTLELLDYACSLAGIIIDRADNGSAVTQNIGASIVNDILNGRFLSEKEATARLSEVGFSLTGIYAIISIQGKRAFTTPNFNSHIGQLAASIYPSCVWLTRKNTLFLLLPIEKDPSDGFPYYRKLKRITEENRRFREMLENNSLHAFVSEPFSDMLLMKDYFIEVKRLPGAVFDDMAIHYAWEHRFSMLANEFASQRNIESLLDKRILAIARHDKQTGSAYLTTLVAHFGNPGDVAAASKQLGVHRNTFAYRIKKIAELFDLDLSSPNDSLNAAFTIDVLQSLSDFANYDS